MIPIAYPRLEDTDVFSSMFAITNYTVSDQRSMEIIKELTCRSELRNVLQYGVEGTHYVFNDDGELRRLNQDYMMNIAYTGNVMMAYPEEGMPLDVWEAAKQQNLQSLLSGVFGTTGKMNTVDVEAWQQMSEISESYFKRLYECETVNEFHSYLTVACAEISASPYYKSLTNMFLSNGDYETASFAGVLSQWWQETFGG
jgi:putative aldouronate transport system substrate-binding protein